MIKYYEKMETIKIQISEVEGLAIKIPTTFNAISFNKFYNQMLAISKIVPTQQLLIREKPKEEETIPIPNSCPDRLRISNWGDKQECIAILNAWRLDKKRGTIAWIKRNKGWVLTPSEVSKISQLVGSIRQKYRKELGL